ncbi:MAG: hypothetical protein AABZ30_09555, partial [Myxococcota bacterium]
MASRALFSVISASAPARAQEFPGDDDWIQARCGALGEPLADAAGDAGADGASDVVGDATAAAGFLARAGERAAFRVRLDANPAPGGMLEPLVWAVAIERNEDPSTYELLALVDGASGEVRLLSNAPATPDDRSDIAETSLGGPWPASSHARVVTAESASGGDADWFLDFLVPLDALIEGGVAPTTTVRVWFGASDGDANLGADVACGDATSTLAAAASRPTTVDPAGDP